jgi:FMN reductase
MRYLIISCSLNPNSRSRSLAQSAFNLLKRERADIELIDAAKLSLPICDGDACYKDPTVQSLSEKILGARGILMATAIYNYDVNAAAKNIVELTGDAWNDKVVGFLCAAGGQNSYMSVMPFANSLMLDFRCVIIPRFVYANRTAFANGEIIDDSVNKRITELTANLIRFTEAIC